MNSATDLKRGQSTSASTSLLCHVKLPLEHLVIISCPFVWSPQSGLGYSVSSGYKKVWDAIPGDQTKGQLVTSCLQLDDSLAVALRSNAIEWAVTSGGHSWGATGDSSYPNRAGI